MPRGRESKSTIDPEMHGLGGFGGGGGGGGGDCVCVCVAAVLG